MTRSLVTILVIVWAFPSLAVNVLVYWSSNPDPVSQYRLSVSQESMVPLTNVVSVTSYAVVSGLDQGETYYFSLTAVNADGYESNPSEPVSFTIPSPTASVIATWDPNAESVLNEQKITYQLSVEVGGSSIMSLLTTNVSTIVCGLTNGQSYSFSLVAINEDGYVSNPSEAVSFSVPDTSPIETTNTNLPPTATPRSLKMTMNTSLPFTLRGSDPNKDPLHYVIRTLPKFGTIVGTPPNIRYTPRTNYVGLDSFTFTVADRQFTSAPATVSLSVRAP